MNEKRKDPRIEVNWPIRVFVDNRSIEGTTTDINLKGICIRCKDPFHSEGNISISIFPPNCKSINVDGKVVWSEHHALDMDNNNVPVCIGLSFIELSLKYRHILKEIIEIPVE
ncbi:PilZ domain-containing protein [Thermodesulfobacteriota bacterium]